VTERLVNEFAKATNALDNGLLVLNKPDKRFNHIYKQLFLDIVNDKQLKPKLSLNNVNNLINRSTIFKNADQLNKVVMDQLNNQLFDNLRKVLIKSNGKYMSKQDIVKTLVSNGFQKAPQSLWDEI